MTRRRRRDARMDAVFRLDAAPAALERALVGRRAPSSSIMACTLYSSASAGAMASRLPSWVARRSTSSQAPAPRSARSSMRVVAICFGRTLCRLRSASRAVAKSRSSSASSARVAREALCIRSPCASARSSQRSRR